ncbi:MAG: hypothetical protein ACXWWU_08455 [Candidatus Limnocylindria bacterium]
MAFGARFEVLPDERGFALAFFAGLAFFAPVAAPARVAFAGDDLAADAVAAALAGALVGVLAGALAADEPAPVDRLAKLPDVDDLDRFGRASPTALMAPEAASPTAPAILPARFPMVFTTLPASGITLSSCVRS